MKYLIISIFCLSLIGCGSNVPTKESVDQSTSTINTEIKVSQKESDEEFLNKIKKDIKIQNTKEALERLEIENINKDIIRKEKVIKAKKYVLGATEYISTPRDWSCHMDTKIQIENNIKKHIQFIKENDY